MKMLKKFFLLGLLFFTGLIRAQFDPESELIRAILSRDASRVEQLISIGVVSAHVKDKNGVPVLAYAAGMGDKRLTELLLKNSSSIDVFNTLKYVVQKRYSFQKGNTEIIIQTLQNCHVDFNSRDENGNTILHDFVLTYLATSFPYPIDIPLIKFLIDAGVNVNAVNADGNTPLHLFVKDGEWLVRRLPDDLLKELIDTFVSAGARLDNKIRNYSGETILDAATLNFEEYKEEGGYYYRGYAKGLIDILKNAGAEYYCQENFEDEDFLNRLYVRSSSWSRRRRVDDHHQQTSLHLADNAEEVSYFLANGMKIYVRNGLDRTPLEEAVYNGKADVVQALLDAGAQIGEALNLALSEKIMTMLLSTGADQMAINEALFGAAFKKYTGKLQLLINAGADPNIRNCEGRTPLHEAAVIDIGPARLDPADSIKILLDAGVDPNVQDKEGNTALHELFGKNQFCFWVVFPDRVFSLKMLLNAGADPNIKNNEQETPLTFAIESADLECAKILLEACKSVASTQQFVESSMIIKASTASVVKLLAPVVDVEDGWALFQASIIGDAQDVKVLLNAGADPNKVPSDIGDKRKTPLYHAMKRNDEDMMAILRDAGATLSATKAV